MNVLQRTGPALLSLAMLGSPAMAQNWNFEGAFAGRLHASESGLNCRGTLIGADLVVTAAHCVIHPQTQEPLAASELHFTLQRGDEPASIHNVSDIGYDPAYRREDVPTREQISRDVAFLRLSESIPGAGDEMASADTAQGFLALLPTGTDASVAADPCAATYEDRGIMVLACSRAPGTSGSPVYGLVDGKRRVVGVISAAGVRNDEGVTFAASPLPQIENIKWVSKTRAIPTGY